MAARAGAQEAVQLLPGAGAGGGEGECAASKLPSKGGGHVCHQRGRVQVTEMLEDAESELEETTGCLLWSRWHTRRFVSGACTQQRRRRRGAGSSGGRRQKLKRRFTWLLSMVMGMPSH